MVCFFRCFCGRFCSFIVHGNANDQRLTQPLAPVILESSNPEKFISFFDGQADIPGNPLATEAAQAEIADTIAAEAAVIEAGETASAALPAEAGKTFATEIARASGGAEAAER